MKTKIKKIIIIAAALVFVSAGAAMAHDRDPKPGGKSYDHYVVKKAPSGWNDKHLKPVPDHNRRYAYQKVRNHRHYVVPYRPPVPRQKVIYKPAPRDTRVVFRIILK
jgi:hypothetical protein